MLLMLNYTLYYQLKIKRRTLLKLRALIIVICGFISLQTQGFANSYQHIIQFQNKLPKPLVVHWNVLSDAASQHFFCEGAAKGAMTVRPKTTLTLGCDSDAKDSAGKTVLSTTYYYGDDKATVTFYIGGTYNRFQPNDNTFSLGRYDCDVGGEMTTLVQCLVNAKKSLQQ